MPGTITFRPIEANLTHNTDILSKMNPYCSFIVGGQKFNSEICKKGGKHPQWTDSISIPTGNESLAIIELMDKDRLTKDDIIGGCSINLNELQASGSSRNWYPLFYKNKPAGEILLETSFSGIGLGSANLIGGSALNQQAGFINNQQSGFINNQQAGLIGGQQAGFIAGQSNLGQSDLRYGQQGLSTVQQTTLVENRTLAPNAELVREERFIDEHQRKTFTEQHQSVEAHSFMKNVEVTETVPVQKQIEVMEARKVLRDVEYTQAVPVMKSIETVEPQVVRKEVEVMEPQLVTKTIQVVENVAVKRQVEVIEMRHTTQNVETFEPQTFHKQVQVTEHVPVMKTVTVSEPVTVTKSVEFVEPIITTQTITKELREPVIVDQRTTQSVGPSSMVGVQHNFNVYQGQQFQLGQQELLWMERFGQSQQPLDEQERLWREHHRFGHQSFGDQGRLWIERLRLSQQPLDEKERLWRQQYWQGQQQFGGFSNNNNTAYNEVRNDKRFL